jgi:hypothetical protein
MFNLPLKKSLGILWFCVAASIGITAVFYPKDVVGNVAMCWVIIGVVGVIIGAIIES